MAAKPKLTRSGAKYKPQPTVLVICEDSKSGKRYLEDASFHFRVKVQVEICHCGHTDPKGIIEAAISRQHKFDQVYCVIDRDTHHSFNAALELASKSKNIGVIASYPCFEFWLLLHFGFTRKSYANGELLNRDLRKQAEMANYDKGQAQSPFKQLLDKFDLARANSLKVWNAALAENEMNPSTQIHELMDVFEKLSKLQHI